MLGKKMISVGRKLSNLKVSAVGFYTTPSTSQTETRNYALHRKSSKTTVSQAQEVWMKKFIEMDIPEPETSIKLILSKILGLKNINLLFKKRDKTLTGKECLLLQEMANLRCQRMPIQYILGEWDFCGLPLKMSHNPSVFIPRPETENLVQIASEIISSLEQTIGSSTLNSLEIGCGSGAISLGLLSKHPNKLQCVGIDANPSAVSLANTNSQLLGFGDRAFFVLASLGKDDILHSFPFLGSAKFDILVSNPPYIPSYEISYLAPEVSWYEDHLALDGGPDGTDMIQLILKQATGWLKRGSFIILEIDPRQVEKIRLITQQSSIYEDVVDVRKDCFGVESDANTDESIKKMTKQLDSAARQIFLYATVSASVM